MKFLILAVLFFGSGWLVADEFRYKQMVTTGLQGRVYDQDGKETTIVISKKSDPQARFLLYKILGLGGINGTSKPEAWAGVPFDQAIILRGTIEEEIHRTQEIEGGAAPEDYQEFILEDILVRFPLARHRAGKVFDTGFLETHFSFKTLFPDGLEFRGRKIDLAKHTAKSEQGSAR